MGFLLFAANAILPIKQQILGKIRMKTIINQNYMPGSLSSNVKKDKRKQVVNFGERKPSFRTKAMNY